MARQPQLCDLTGTVLEAIGYRRCGGGNENPALGKALLYVDRFLLPWARRQLADADDDYSTDAENLVAEAGVKAIAAFGTFTGLTGGEFFEWVKSILAQLIAGVKRLRAALNNGGLRHASSVDRNAEAAMFIRLLASPDDSAEAVAMLHERASRLHRAIRQLSMIEQRIVKLVMAGQSLRAIAATFGHSPHWAQAHFEAAARHLRQRLLKRPS